MNSKYLNLAVKCFVCIFMLILMVSLQSCQEEATSQGMEAAPVSVSEVPVQSAPQVAAAPAEEPVSAAAAVVEPVESPSQAAVADTTDTSGLVPIELELPKPLFIGTPQDIEVEYLEKPLGKARPPFLAPAGTTNMALGRPVTSSDKFPIIGELSYITNGNKDATDGNYVELGLGVQNVVIDLGQQCNIYAVVVWHLHRQPVVFFDIVVQTSNDQYFIENVNTIFNNDIDNSAGLGIGKDMHYTETNEGKLIDAKGVTGRYVRLYSNGYNLEDFNYYTEVAVYAKPVE